MISNCIKKAAIVFACAVCAGLLCPDSYAYDFSGGEVVSVEVISESNEMGQYVYELFKDIKGQPLSYRKVGLLIRAMKNKEDVEKVTVNASDLGNGKVELLVNVRLKFRVKRTVFQGNERVSDSKLRSEVNIENNSLADTHDLETAVQKIRDFYGSLGYLQAEVSFERIFHQNRESGTLYFRIVEGERCRISDVVIEGELNGKSPDDIRAMLKIKSRAPLDMEYIGLKIKRLERNLLKQGFRQVSIEDPRIDYDAGSNTSRLILTVKLGPRIKISFKGNRYFFERSSKLENIIRLADEKRFSPSWVDSARFELERFYKKLGYARVSVTYDDVTNEKGTERLITFNIRKNKKVLIKKIEFTGNSHFEGEYLEKKILELGGEAISRRWYVREDLRAALRRLIAHYQTQGYLRAFIVGDPAVKYDRHERRVSITVSVFEGKRYFFGKVGIKGNTFVSDSYVRTKLALKEGDPFDPFALTDNISTLEAFYRENGFKFVKIYRQETISEDRVDVSIVISEGDRVSLGSIRISGNRTTNEKIIRREFIIKEGEYYSPERLTQSEREIATLGVFSSVAFEEENYNSETKEIDIVLNLREKKKRNLRARVGYGSDEGLRGGTDLTFINIGGKGRSLAFGFELSHRLNKDNILRRKETVSYREPSLFGSKLAGKIGLLDERNEEPQFNIDRSAFSIGFDASLTKALRSSLTYNLEYRKPFDLKVPEEDLSPFDESRKRLAFMDLTVDYDRRNNIFNTTRGSFQRLIFDIYNRGIGSESNFLQIYMQNSFYRPIYGRLRAVLSVKFGFSWTYGFTNNEGLLVPIEKRFRLGGPYTIRGFPYNSVGGLSRNQPVVGSGGRDDQASGGDCMFNYNFELISPLPFNFDFVLFTDGGEAWKTNREFNPWKIRNTAGFGIRYNTPIGPVRLDVGFILDRRSGEDWGQIHFSVGQL